MEVDEIWHAIVYAQGSFKPSFTVLRCLRFALAITKVVRHIHHYKDTHSNLVASNVKLIDADWSVVMLSNCNHTAPSDPRLVYVPPENTK